MPIDQVHCEPGVLVHAENIEKSFRVEQTFFRGKGQKLRAVDGVDLRIFRGETLGLVGESGCGKTTVGRLILRLETLDSGRVWFEDRDISRIKLRDMQSLRRKMQIIFQDPYSSLNPRRTVRSAIAEPLVIHSIGSRKHRAERVRELMEEVGLRPEFADRYPHEFSGGQRQRIGIARALALNPSLIIADEPVSALDVSIRAQVLNLMEDLQEKYNLTYLFVSHDLSVVEHISDRVAVMYLGKIAEIGPKTEIYMNPTHPYTEALLSAAPVPDPTVKRNRIILQGDVPSPINPPMGCRFHTRCWLKTDICAEISPELKDVGGGHLVSCHVRAPAQ